MQITPVRKYRTPRLPTHDILDQHPELLRIVPRRWRRNPVVLTALAMACLLLQSCKSTTAPKSVSKVAPIFVHGDGIGVYGCVATAAPHYLSEDEARSIIVEEAKKAGIDFLQGRSLSNVAVPRIKKLEWVAPRKDDGTLDRPPLGWPTRRSTVYMDGTSTGGKVSFEFISDADFHSMASKARMTSSAGMDDVLGASVLFQKGLENARTDGYYAVFYDPVARYGSSTNDPNRSAASNAQAQQDLRAQVKDFIKWLKAQGVI